MTFDRTPSLHGSSVKDSLSLTGWGIADISGDQEKNVATYSELLKDPRWQKRRLHMLEASGWVCDFCGDAGKTLHVHHKRYIKGRKPWEYEDDLLQVLCEGCHELHHSAKEELNAIFDCHGEGGIYGLIAGFVNSDKECGTNSLLITGCGAHMIAGYVASIWLNRLSGQHHRMLAKWILEVDDDEDARFRPLSTPEREILTLLAKE